jgi:hypothetical protein
MGTRQLWMEHTLIHLVRPVATTREDPTMNTMRYLLQGGSFEPHNVVISGSYNTIEQARDVIARVRKTGNTNPFYITEPLTPSRVEPYRHYRHFTIDVLTLTEINTIVDVPVSPVPYESPFRHPNLLFSWEVKH